MTLRGRYDRRTQTLVFFCGALLAGALDGEQDRRWLGSASYSYLSLKTKHGVACNVRTHVSLPLRGSVAWFNKASGIFSSIPHDDPRDEGLGEADRGLMYPREI